MRSIAIHNVENLPLCCVLRNRKHTKRIEFLKTMENAGECKYKKHTNAIKSKISYDCRFYCSVERSTLVPITYDYPE